MRRFTYIEEMETFKILISIAIAFAAVVILSVGLPGNCGNQIGNQKTSDDTNSKEIVSEQFFKFRTFPVAFTTRKIPKGHSFTAADLEDRQISLEHVPADAVVTCKKLYGKKSVLPINERTVVSVQDIGLHLKENEIVGTNVRDYKYNSEKMCSIYVAKVELKPGENIRSEQIMNSKMPLRLVPCDAVLNSAQILGKKCKYGCAKNHIIMKHDVL